MTRPLDTVYDWRGKRYTSTVRLLRAVDNEVPNFGVSFGRDAMFVRARRPEGGEELLIFERKLDEERNSTISAEPYRDIMAEKKIA